MLVPMLPLTAIDYLLMSAFCARLNARTPVLVGVLCVGRHLVVALALIEPHGAAGLAFANAVQNSAHGLILPALRSPTAFVRVHMARFSLWKAASTWVAVRILAEWR